MTAAEMQSEMLPFPAEQSRHRSVLLRIQGQDCSLDSKQIHATEKNVWTETAFILGACCAG